MISCGVKLIKPINDKNLDYEIETSVHKSVQIRLNSPINDKNLDYEIETWHFGSAPVFRFPINDKNLDYEIETCDQCGVRIGKSSTDQ